MNRSPKLQNYVTAGPSDTAAIVAGSYCSAGAATIVAGASYSAGACSGEPSGSTPSTFKVPEQSFQFALVIARGKYLSI